MQREISVIVAEADQTCTNECRHGYDSGGCDCLSFKQRILSIDDLFKEPWFLEMVENRGFFSKEDPGKEYIYRNHYVYEIRHNGSSYSNFGTKPPMYYHPKNSLKAVYQEVIGPERIKAVAQWKKKVAEYEKRQTEIKKKAAAKAEEKKKLRELKKLEKAKQLIAELELKSDNFNS